MTKPKPIHTLSPLKRWLRKNNKSMIELAQMVGCDRRTVSRIDNDFPVEEHHAIRMSLITGGEIRPAVKNKGRPRKK